MVQRHKQQIQIEVIYALADEQQLITIKVNQGTTLKQAIEQSGILQKYPQIDLNVNKVGIFSRITDLNAILNDGDRIEIYRPLIMDAKAARKKRAEKSKK